MGNQPREATEHKPVNRAGTDERPALEPPPPSTHDSPVSWSHDRLKQTRDHEETYDYNAQLRGSDIYQAKNKDGPPADKAAPPADKDAPRNGETEPRDGSAPPKDGADKPREQADLAVVDKKFPSIDAALKARGDARDEKILPDKLPDPLPYDLSRIPGATREVLEKVRDEVRTNNLEPEKVVPSLMKDVRVLGLGESHFSDNPQRQFGTKMIPELAKNGATHLAIEVDSNKQPIFDEFMKTGKLNILELPALLQDSEFVKMLNAARDAGMKIVAVDDHTDSGKRDQAMAKNIEKVLDQNPDNKVVFWVGAAHLQRISDPAVNPDIKVASQILEQKYKTATVVPNIGTFDGSTLANATPDLTRPALLPISRMPNTSNLRSDALDIPKSWYRDSDFVIVYPKLTKY